MNSESNEIHAEVQNVTPVPPESAVQAEPQQPEAAEKPKPPASAFQRFLRSLLIWLIVIVVAFLAGVLTLFFTRYQPLGAILAQSQGELAQANQRVSQLKAEATAVNEQLAGVKTENEAMRSDLDTANAHLGLQQVLVDVTNARLALLNDDVTAAKAALKETPARLEALAPQIATVDENLAKSMPQRLTLILSGLDSDTETAKTDLELLAGNLVNVETLLFGK